MLGRYEDQAAGSGACGNSSLVDSFRRLSCEFGLERVQPGAPCDGERLGSIAAGFSQMSGDVVIEQQGEGRTRKASIGSGAGVSGHLVRFVKIVQPVPV